MLPAPDRHEMGRARRRPWMERNGADTGGRGIGRAGCCCGAHAGGAPAMWQTGSGTARTRILPPVGPEDDASLPIPIRSHVPPHAAVHQRRATDTPRYKYTYRAQMDLGARYGGVLLPVRLQFLPQLPSKRSVCTHACLASASASNTICYICKCN